MKGRNSRRRETVAVEIGSSAIKVVRLAHREDGPLLMGYTYRRLTREAKPRRGDGGSPAEPGRLADALRAAVRALDPEITGISLVLSGPEVFFRTVDLPPVKGSAVGRAVRWQLGQWVKTPVEKLAIEYQVVGRREEEGKELLEVQVAAVPQAMVENALALSAAAGFLVRRITVAPIALEAFLNRYGWVEEGVPLGVADLGADGGTVYVFRGAVCELARDFRAGGNQLTGSLTEEVQDVWGSLDAVTAGTIRLSWSQAERAKKRYCIPPEVSSEPDGTPQAAGSSVERLVTTLMQPAVEKVVREVGRSLEFASREVIKEGVKRLLLVGGTAKLGHLSELMARGVGAATRVLTPPESLLEPLTPRCRQALVRRAPELAVTLGLAILGETGMDFIPPEEKARRRQARIRPLLITAAVVIALGAVGLRALLAMEHANRRDALKRGERALLTLAQQDHMLERALLQTSDNVRVEKAAGKALEPFRRPLYAAEVWKALGHAATVGVELTRAEIEFPSMGVVDEDGDASHQGEITLEGMTRGRGDEVDLTLLEFLLALEETPFFGTPRVTMRTRGTEEQSAILRFALSCPLE